MLLESIYQEFDSVAHRRRVFKVETVGDCYGEFVSPHTGSEFRVNLTSIAATLPSVAVCGLPDPRKNHAVVSFRTYFQAISPMETNVQSMFLQVTARFANDILFKFNR